MSGSAALPRCWGVAAMTAEETARELLSQRVELTGYLRALTRDAMAAEDVFQDTTVKAVARAAEFRDAEHLRRWFYRAGRNAAIDAVRRAARHASLLPEAALEALAEDEERNASTPDWRLRMVSLRECLATLTPRAREILELRYAHDLTGEAVAHRLDRETDSIYRSLSRTYHHLRECIRRREATGGTGHG